MARTVVDLDEKLVREARKLTGLTKKVELVNFALKRLIQQKELEGILQLKGKVAWQGNLQQMRKDRDFSR